MVFFAMCRHNGDEMRVSSDTETDAIIKVNVRPLPSDPSKPCSRWRSQCGSGPLGASAGNAVCASDRWGIVLWDGHPLLGRSKTWRGFAAAIVLSVCAAVLIDLPWLAGTVTAACAMAGDCVSSFIKRRFGLEPSSMMLGLDQVPESLFPAVACSAYLPLGPLDIALIVLVFSVGELAMSRLFFAVGLRDRPY